MTERERFPEDWDPIEDGGYLAARLMDDGRYWCLMQLTFGRLRIVIAEDWSTAGEHWCYSNNVDAVLSYDRGPDVPPTGWSRHTTFPDYKHEYPDLGEKYADVVMHRRDNDE